MGPCCYCKQMIYDDWIAERGYHRDCREKHLAEIKAREEHAKLVAGRWAKLDRKAAKRRIRRAEIRRERKLV